MHYPLAASIITIIASLPISAFADPAPPKCRLVNEGADTVQVALRLALDAYAAIGHALPIDEVSVNRTSDPGSKSPLTVYLLADASIGSVNKSGCVNGSPSLVKGEELDALSVRGGCIAVSGEAAEIRCSSQAIQVFGLVGNRPEKKNPALLYVLAHELAHIQQRRAGEYAGRVEPIHLKAPQASKLAILQESCEPGLTQTEEDADRFAVEVVARLLTVPPYREPMFSPFGSVLWGADQINLAANTWRTIALEREFMSQPKPHASFVPTEFPTPQVTVEQNAKRFVCDVLTRHNGTVQYPGNATSHPPLEERMQRVAESLRLLAQDLPKTGAQQSYQPAAVLQEQLSDIFTFMYRENGVYLSAVQSAICTRVNSDNPVSDCKVAH